MPRLPSTTGVDPDDQRAMLTSLVSLMMRKNPAAVDRFCSLLWEYLGSNYHTQADFNNFIAALNNYTFKAITVDSIVIGGKLRLRVKNGVSVVEVLGLDNNWHQQLHWSSPVPT